MSDKRIPKPGEVWRDKYNDRAAVLNVYPDCLTYNWTGASTAVLATTLDDFVNRYTPPEPAVVQSIHVMFDGVFWLTTEPLTRSKVGTIAAMSDGTFRFEAAS